MRQGETGNIIAAYKVADMYRYGLYVEQDYDRYCRTIESLYPMVKNTDWLNDPLPEISMRLAEIRRGQGKTDEAVQLLLYARPFLAQRIMCDPFFGDLNNMARLIHDLYELIEFDTSSVKLYDLYYLLQKPCRVTFRLADRRYEVEADFL